MLRNLFTKTLRDQRRSLMWWSIGIAALVVLTLLFYPSMRDAPELNDLLGEEDSLARAFFGDIADLTSPEGYLNSQLFFLMVPILVLVFGIGQGGGAIAGEEERGTLDLLLSNPLTRTRVVLEKFAAMAVAILALSAVLWLSVVAGAAIVSMDIGLGRVAEATLSATLLGVLFGSLALLLGSATGKRGMSIGLASAVAVAAYLVNSLVPAVEVLEPIRRVSPFYYYIEADPLTNGLNLLHAVVLLGVTAVLAGASVFTFERRDLGV